MSADERLIQQFAAQKGYESRTLPMGGGDSWSPDGSVVARYLLHLRAIGLKDPTKPSATDLYEQALRLRERSVSVAVASDEAGAIATALALGDLTPAEAAKRLAKAPRPGDAHEQAARERQMLYAATRQAYAAAVRAIHNFDWLDLLRPLVEDAVAAQDDERFRALHDFAALLRSRELGALAMVATDTSGIREFEETWRYTTGAPDKFHLWRLERATAAQPIFSEVVGPVTFVAAAIKEAPFPTVSEMVEAKMEPGLYSAGEVLAIAGRIVLEQEEARALAAAPPGAPARSSRGADVMSEGRTPSGT
jgi:hypothetical protein